MSALMTSVLDNTSKIIEYIAEIETNNIKLLNPDINESDEGFTPTEKGIRFALLRNNFVQHTLYEVIREVDKCANKSFYSNN